MKRPSYKAALEWIALNDDTEFLNDEHGQPSVTLLLVADLFGKSVDLVMMDLRKTIKKIDGEA